MLPEINFNEKDDFTIRSDEIPAFEEIKKSGKRNAGWEGIFKMIIQANMAKWAAEDILEDRPDAVIQERRDAADREASHLWQAVKAMGGREAMVYYYSWEEWYAREQQIEIRERQ